MGFYDGVANWADWISYWKCHFCLHLCSTSQGPSQCIVQYFSCPIVFDLTLPNFDVEPIESKGWEEFYEVDDEPVPEPREMPMKMTCFVDASRASNKVTDRSDTGIFILLNIAPVVWYSKRQNTVE